MADRFLERAFTQAYAAVNEEQKHHDPEFIAQQTKHKEDAGLRKLTTSMTAADAIRRILLATKDKDYFR
jgi:hypothetical protein